MSDPEQPQTPEILDTETTGPRWKRPRYYNEYMMRFAVGAGIGALIDWFLIRYQSVLAANKVIDQPPTAYELIAIPLALGFIVMVWSEWRLGQSHTLPFFDQ